jgi:hypothetical protein
LERLEGTTGTHWNYTELPSPKPKHFSAVPVRSRGKKRLLLFAEAAQLMPRATK